MKIPVLKSLIEQEKRGEIDLRYLDRSGFSPTPYIPYGWQEKANGTGSKAFQVLHVRAVRRWHYRAVSWGFSP